MADRGPESLGRLPGQGSAGAIGDRARDHHRHSAAQALEDLLEGIKSRFGIERVEDGLDHDQLGTALDQGRGRLGVGGGEGVEVHGAMAWIADIRADARGLVGGAEDPHREARTARVAGLELAAGSGGERGTGAVELRDERLGAVVGLRDARGVEGVGLDEIMPAAR